MTRPPLRLHYSDRRRSWAAIAILVASVALLISLNGQWWKVTQVDVNAGSASNPGGFSQVPIVGISINLGGALACSAYGQPGNPANQSLCTSASQASPGPVGPLYAIAEDVLLALGAAMVVATATAFVGAFGAPFPRLFVRAFLVVLLVLPLVMAGVLAATIVSGPGPSARQYCLAFSQNTTTCPGEWGTVTVPNPDCYGDCEPELVYGAGSSFYLVVAAAGFMALGWAFLWVGRKGPWSRAEREAWAGDHLAVPVSTLPPHLRAVPSQGSPATGRAVPKRCAVGSLLPPLHHVRFQRAAPVPRRGPDRFARKTRVPPAKPASAAAMSSG